MISVNLAGSNLPRKVLITGASGLIGSRLCEVMTLGGVGQPRAFVHSTASAARIARFPMDFFIGDLCDRKCVERAVQECDAVVHLARGGKTVMHEGLDNLLRAAAYHGVSRFVHMSSVAVYGNHPPPESISETAPARRSKMEYGNEKLAQEKRVLKYWRDCGLPVVILRPPNVYGPFSTFTVDIINRIRSGRLAIVDDGRNPCNVVYVDNLVEAILLALWKSAAIGEIFFVTEPGGLSWEQFLDDHGALLGCTIPRVSATQLVGKPRETLIRNSLRVAPRVLLSGELRGILREIPVVRSFETLLYAGFQSLSVETRQKIRDRVQRRVILQKYGVTQKVVFAHDNIHAAQCRTVPHSSDKARRMLGYTAGVSYQEGMKLTEAWLKYSRFL